jgi:hypothetical protein
MAAVGAVADQQHFIVGITHVPGVIHGLTKRLHAYHPNAQEEESEVALCELLPRRFFRRGV